MVDGLALTVHAAHAVKGARVHAGVVDAGLALGAVTVLNALHAQAADARVSGSTGGARADWLVVDHTAAGALAAEGGAGVDAAAILALGGKRAVAVGLALGLGLAASD